MENTWLIGRTWKPREGWSRPVLTVERQHYTPAPSRGGKNRHHSDDRETPCTPHYDPFSRVHYPVPNPPRSPKGTRGDTIPWDV